MKWMGTKNLGMLLLAIWLVLTGVFALVTISFNTVPILAVLAIAAGVLLLLGK